MVHWIPFLAASLLLSPPVLADLVGVASVTDGDTIEVHGRPIRLHGVDAPEGGQQCQLDGKPWRCGQAAANALADHIGRKTVRCTPGAQDRYGRTVAICAVSGSDVSAWLVRNGWALAFRAYSADYVGDEAAAKAGKRGLWRSEFIPPWEWRAKKRSKTTASLASAAPPSGCGIKGNISSTGERIYHLPGDRYYAKTGIDLKSGERWFCNEAEARASGWRRSQR